MPETVNSQVTDAMTQADTNAAPASLSMLYQATAQALAMAAHNATVAQQNANTILQATTTQGVALLLSLDVTGGRATRRTGGAAGE